MLLRCICDRCRPDKPDVWKLLLAPAAKAALWDWRVPTWADISHSGNLPDCRRVGCAIRHLFKAMERVPSEESHTVIVGLLAELPPDQMASIHVLNAVADSGHVAVMRQLLTWQPHADLDTTTCTAAVVAGHLPMLQYLRSLPLPLE